MIIGKRYKAKQELGKGGMGLVYLCEDLKTKKDVAVKKLIGVQGENATTETVIQRFKSEIATMSLVQHKNIVKIYDFKFGPDFNDYYIAQEFVSGNNLDTIIKRRVFLDQKEAVDYIIQILDAVSYMSKKGLLHRDLKPANIMITNSGLVKLCDFGLTKLTNHQLGITTVGAVAGTPYYLAPEIIQKYKATVQSEIYSLGAILFEMLTGSKPFQEDENTTNAIDARNQLYTKILNSPLPSVKNIAKEVPQALENVVIKATAKRPSERHKRFEEFKMDLESAFSPSRNFEQKLHVTNKFAHMFSLEKKQTNTEKHKMSLPTHTVVFVAILFILMIGAIIYYVK